MSFSESRIKYIPLSKRLPGFIHNWLFNFRMRAMWVCPLTQTLASVFRRSSIRCAIANFLPPSVTLIFSASLMFGNFRISKIDFSSMSQLPRAIQKLTSGKSSNNSTIFPATKSPACKTVWIFAARRFSNTERKRSRPPCESAMMAMRLEIKRRLKTKTGAD